MERKVNVLEDLNGNNYEHKKRNEYPFPVRGPYSVKNSFLEFII